MKKLILGMLFLGSCAPNSLEDYQREGEALTRKLIHQLEEIHSREDLLKHQSNLEKYFEKLIDLIIEARNYQYTHPEDASLYDSFTSDLLKKELERIYEIEGGRETIELAQHEALLRLDAFEKNLAKQQLLRR